MSSMPEPPSIEMSTMAMAGFNDPIICNALGALSASPQTWRSGCWFMRVASHSRTKGWSSTSRILVFWAMDFRRDDARRQLARDARPACQHALDLEGCADDAGPVGHGAQAHAGRNFLGHAHTVVANRQRDPVRPRRKAHLDLFGVAVFDGVSDRLLRDPIQMSGHRRFADRDGLV